MAKKVGGFTVFLPDIEISDAQLDDLASKARVAFGPEARADLRRLIATYAEDRACWAAAPLPKPVATKLKAVATAAAVLNKALNGLLRGGAGAADEAAAAELRHRLADNIDLADLRIRLAHVQRAAEQAAASLPIKRAPPGLPHRDRMVAAMCTIYRDAGGRARVSTNAGKPPGGPLIDLIVAAMKLAGDRQATAAAVANKL